MATKQKRDTEGFLVNERGQRIAEPTKFNQPNKNLETQLSKKISDWLNETGVWNTRLQSGRVQVMKQWGTKKHVHWIHFGHEGCPDRIAINQGKTFFIEVKKPGQKPSDVQKKEHDLLRIAGAYVILTDSIEDFKWQWWQVNSFSATVTPTQPDTQIEYQKG